MYTYTYTSLSMTNLIEQDLGTLVGTLLRRKLRVVIAVMSLLMQWPDHQLHKRVVTGFQAIGDLEITNIWQPLEVTVDPVAFTPTERK